VFMNKLFLILASACFFTFSNCSKEIVSNEVNNNNSGNTFPDKNVIGKYTGTIISKCDYIPLSQGKAYSETKTDISTVTITSDTSTYLLNGTIMTGGPTVFSLQGYVLNTKNLTIDFSKSNSGRIWSKYFGGNHEYNFTCFSSGQLLHE
jgi:hypothetical protein